MEQFGYDPSGRPGPPGPPPRRGMPPWVVAIIVGVLIGAVVGGGVLLLTSGDDDEEEPVAEDESTDDTGDTESTETTEPTELDPAGTLTGTWEGTYECAEGPTGLKLTVVDFRNGEVDAAFELPAASGDPAVTNGGYWMAGTIDGGTLSLAGDVWIGESGTEQMVGLTAELGEGTTTDHLEGTVDGEGCTTFSIDRTSPEPWYVGTWAGVYDCSQGRTGITLTISETDPGAVEALYEFYEVPENPGVPSGSYTLTGTYDDHSVTLDPDEWVDQPTGYVMVGIVPDSEIVTGPGALAGRIDEPSCEGYLLGKQ